MFFQVLLTIVIMWSICGILTATGVFPPGHPARTDLKVNIIEDAPWFRVPYPGKFLQKYTIALNRLDILGSLKSPLQIGRKVGLSLPNCKYAVLSCYKWGPKPYPPNRSVGYTDSERGWSTGHVSRRHRLHRRVHQLLPYHG